MASDHYLASTLLCLGVKMLGLYTRFALEIPSRINSLQRNAAGLPKEVAVVALLCLLQL